MDSFKTPLLLLLSSLFLHTTLATIVCDVLPKEKCAFSIASSGQRCLLETYLARSGSVEYQCRTSDVLVQGNLAGYVETNECVAACGVDRNSVGISSDALLEPQFTNKLCSPACYHKCPNIVDLYFNLAAGEGAFLPALCEVQRTNPHRSVIEILSSGGFFGGLGAAYAPASAPTYASAPSPQ